MAAAQQHQFDGLTLAQVEELISLARQHQFDDLTVAEVEETEEIWRHRGAIIAEAEEVLRHKKSWLNLATRLIYMFLGVFLIIAVAITEHTRTDLIAIGVVSCMLFVAGIGFMCWDAYLCAQIEHFLPLIKWLSDAGAAMDLESAGQLAAPTTTS